MRSGLACHGILRHAFLDIFKGRNGRKIAQTSYAVLVDSLAAELVAYGGDQDAALSFTVPDTPASKVQGVRAKKSCDYLCREATTTEMCISVLASLPVETYSFWLFKRQSEKSWLDKDPAQRPIVAPSSDGDKNPLIRALADFVSVVHALPSESLASLLDGSRSAISMNH